MTGPLYAVLTDDAGVDLPPWLGAAHRTPEDALASAEALSVGAPPGITVEPVTVIPGVLPPRIPGIKRLYVAGPMTGYPEWNFPAFAKATEALRSAGYQVISPAELDLAVGFDPRAPKDGFTREHLLAALRRDSLAVLSADGIAVLGGWEQSRGATAEVYLADAAGIPARPVYEWTLTAREELFQDVTA